VKEASSYCILYATRQPRSRLLLLLLRPCYLKKTIRLLYVGDIVRACFDFLLIIGWILSSPAAVY
jgi:hypothetical protein